MLGILRKDYSLFTLAALVAFPAALVVEILISTDLHLASVVLNVLLTWLLALGSLAITELEEERSNGYVLLSTLPIRTREFVGAKFLLFLGTLGACTVAQLIFLKVMQAAPSLLAIAHSTALLSASVCLVLGGLAYIGIFTLGYRRFTIVALTVFTAFGLVPPILLSMGKPAARELLHKAGVFLLQLNGLGVVLAGLALYVLLFLVSTALFRHETRQRAMPLL